jgi:hypothetical protein
MLLAALPEWVSRFLGLGTGDGRLLAAIRERIPRPPDKRKREQMGWLRDAGCADSATPGEVVGLCGC